MAGDRDRFRLREEGDGDRDLVVDLLRDDEDENDLGMSRSGSLFRSYRLLPPAPLLWSSDLCRLLPLFLTGDRDREERLLLLLLSLSLVVWTSPSGASVTGFPDVEEDWDTDGTEDEVVVVVVLLL